MTITFCLYLAFFGDLTLSATYLAPLMQALFAGSYSSLLRAPPT